MKRKLIILCAIVVSVSACGQNKHKNIVTAQAETEQNGKEITESANKKELEVFAQYFKEKKYKTPDEKTFKERISYYFGIDDISNEEIIYTCSNIKINVKGRFLYPFAEDVFYYPEYEAKIGHEAAGSVEEVLDAFKFSDSGEFLMLNKLIFYDDSTALHYFLNPDNIRDYILQGNLLKIYKYDAYNNHNILCPEIHSIKVMAKIKDNDGYVNLREGASSQSKIIDKIYNNSIVTILEWGEIEQTEPMWKKVLTTNGLEGYIHKSRLNPFIQKP